MMYWTKTEGIGGEIKKFPEDFIVEEKKDGKIWTIKYGFLDKLMNSFSRGSGDHIHLTLIKRNRTTMDITKQISKKMGIHNSKIGYAGLKDKRAITSQRISIEADIDDVKKINIRDVYFKNISKNKKKIRIGHSMGNVFTIKIRNVKKDSLKILHKFKKYEKLPNLYGPQRFGGNEDIGRELVKGDLKSAVELISTHSGYFERRVKTMINHPKRAIKHVPRKIMIFYKNAYQSYVFNKALEEYGWKSPKFLPLPGFKTELDEVTKKILENECVKKSDFKKNRMKGTFRRSFFIPEWINEKQRGNDMILKFFLRKGTYATTLLRELMKNG